MKKLTIAILLLFLAGPCLAQEYCVGDNCIEFPGKTTTTLEDLAWIQYARMSTAIVGGGVTVAAGCSTPATHLVDQGFETDFPLTGWTTSSTAAASGVTLLGTPPTASCTKGVYFPDDTTQRYISYDYGTNQNTMYFRFDFYIDSSTVASTDYQRLIVGGESVASTGQIILNVRNVTGTLKLHGGATGTTDLDITVTIDAWHTITGYVDSTTSSNSWIKFDGGEQTANTTFGSNTRMRYWMLGDIGNHKTLDYYYGYFALDDEEIAN
jgi:hypothetical protein